MNTPPPSSTATHVVDVLKQRQGTLTQIELLDGRQLAVYNIAWGQDFGDPEYHITSNISPAPSVPPRIDIFSSGDVKQVSDPSSGQVFYEKQIAV
jgi:hypothetical protein